MKAWRVTIWDYEPCILFSNKRSEARWFALSSYWEAFGRSKNSFPKLKINRAPEYDNSNLVFRSDARCWGEDYVKEHHKSN